jgi:aminoglycoside 2''-phosphotransferase
MHMSEHSPPDQACLGFADMHVATFVRHITARYPALVVRSARIEPAGQRCSVLVINDTIVFRFPRTQVEVDALSIEASILRAVRDDLPLPTPDLAYENLGTRAVGTTFLGYPRLPGEPLWPDILNALGAATRLSAAAQLALFLQGLHSVPASALPIDLPLRDDHDEWSELYGRVRDKLFPMMRPEKRAMVAEHFERYLAEWDRASYQPVLRHGDFGPSNILFDVDSRTISGIVDFGSAALGDPALDIAGVMGPFGYGETFVRSFVGSYPAVETLLPRARFYAGTFALQEALWGLEHGDQRALDSGIAAYR